MAQICLLFIGARHKRAALRLLAKLLQFLVDLVCRAPGIVDDALRLFSRLRGSLFLLLLNLLVVFLGLLFLLFRLQPQLLCLEPRLLHLLALLFELVENILEVHVVLADHASCVFQDRVVQPQLFGNREGITFSGNAD